MQKRSPGDVFKLTSQDLGVPDDLLTWCRMTGRRLLGPSRRQQRK